MEQEKSKITAIVLAAGKGSRMNMDIPKQYLLVEDKPVMVYSLECFEKSGINDIILVVNDADISFCQNEIVDKYNISKVSKIVGGGVNRYDSVKKGLDAAKGTDFVLIHDAARPFLTNKIITDSINAVKQFGACTVGVPVKDTIKVVDTKGFGEDTPDRSKLWQVQTPQSFRYLDLQKAYQIMESTKDTDITDDTMIIERYLGKKTKVIMGDYRNIKVTTKEDLLIMTGFLRG